MSNIDSLFEERFEFNEDFELDLGTQDFLEDLDFQEILSEMKADLNSNKPDNTQIDYQKLEERLNHFINEKEEEFKELEEQLQKPRKEIVREVVREEPVEIEPDLSKFESQFNNLMQNWNKRFNALVANMNMRAPTGSSGGSTRILDNDDVVFSQLDSVANNQVLAFDGDKRKFFVSNTVNDLQRDFRLQAMTGLVSGGELSVSSVSNTSFDISAGTAEFVNIQTIDSPKGVTVDFGPYNGVEVNNITSQNVTFVSLDQELNIIQRDRKPTPGERRNEVFLGAVIHSNRSSVSLVNNLPTVALQVGTQLYDLMYGIGRFVIEGLSIGSFNGNLQIKSTEGQIFVSGGNFQDDETNPHYLDIPEQNPATFRYRTQDGTEFANTQFIEPDFYDLNGTKTAIPGADNRASIQHVYMFPSGAIRIQYGQDYYGSITEAIENVNVEDFITENNISENAILLGLIVARKGATDLSLITDARFLTVGRFGDKGSVTTTPIGTLQQIYNNSVLDAEIVLNENNTGININDAATPLNTRLLSVSNNDDSVQYFFANSEGIGVTGNVVSTGQVTSFTRLPVTSNTFTVTNTSFSTTDGFIGVSNQNANTIITIQSGFEVGRKLYIKDEAGNASKNRIKVNTVDNVDGANNFTLSIDRGSITMIYTGFEWSIV